MSPSLSMSPNAAPRLDFSINSPPPTASLTSLKSPCPPFLNNCLGWRYFVRVPNRSISGVDVAVGDEEIEQAVVVEIGEPGAPAEVRERRRHDTSLMAHVAEKPSALLR